MNKVVPRSNPPLGGGLLFFCIRKEGVTVMSGENRRYSGWLLPVLVVAVGAYFLVNALQRGALEAVALKPVNWAGLALMAVGLVAAVALRKRDLWKLAATLVCGVGAILVICL